VRPARPSALCQSVLGELASEGPLDELLQRRSHGTAQQLSEAGEIPRHVDHSIIDRHLDSSAETLQLDLAAIGGPLDMPQSEPTGGFSHHRLEAPLGLFETLAVGDAHVYQRHGRAR